MRVLVLHQHYWPEIAATAQILSDLCEDLAQRGHSVTVICGQPSYRNAGGSERPLPTDEVHAGVRIRRVWSYVPPRRSIPRRLAQYGVYFTLSLATAIATEDYDVALVLSSPPLLLGATGSLLKQLRRRPFVYSVQDLYPDVALHVGVLRPGVFASTIGLVSNLLYRNADHVVTLSRGMAELLTGKGVATERVTVVPNWADTSHIRQLPRDNAFARAHDLAEPFVVLYSGNIGLSQGLEHLIGAARTLTDLPVLFVVCGEGNARAALQAAAVRERLPNLRFLPPQPRALLPELLASCDVGLVPMKRGVSADLVPSKLYGLMAAGRPVLASVESDSEVARVVTQARCGVVVAPEDPSALVNGVREIYDRRYSIQPLGEAGRHACERLYSRATCTQRYEDVLLTASLTRPATLLSTLPHHSPRP